MFAIIDDFNFFWSSLPSSSLEGLSTRAAFLRFLGSLLSGLGSRAMSNDFLEMTNRGFEETISFLAQTRVSEERKTISGIVWACKGDDIT